MGWSMHRSLFNINLLRSSSMGFHIHAGSHFYLFSNRRTQCISHFRFRFRHSTLNSRGKSIQALVYLLPFWVRHRNPFNRNCIPQQSFRTFQHSDGYSDLLRSFHFLYFSELDSSFPRFRCKSNRYCYHCFGILNDL